LSRVPDYGTDDKQTWRRHWLVPLAVLALGAGASAPAPLPGGCAANDATSDVEAVAPEGFALTVAQLVDPSGGVTELCLWVADTPERQARGLMQVTDLGGADGMVFVFDEATETRFYMWQTPQPLTIAFFDDAGQLIDATEMKPCLSGPSDRCPRYAPTAPFRMALEAPTGALDDLLVDGVVLELDGTVWLSPVPEKPGPATTRRGIGTEDNQTSIATPVDRDQARTGARWESIQRSSVGPDSKLVISA
jgi:uncharacterized membrane protein (UPF0127 family)